MKTAPFAFDLRAVDKAAAKAAADAKMADVVAAQPDLATAQPAMQAAIAGVIDMLPDDPAQDVTVSVNGSISYASDPTVPSGADLGCSVRLAAR